MEIEKVIKSDSKSKTKMFSSKIPLNSKSSLDDLSERLKILITKIEEILKTTTKKYKDKNEIDSLYSNLTVNNS
jgi:hypothetical protein